MRLCVLWAAAPGRRGSTCVPQVGRAAWSAWRPRQYHTASRDSVRPWPEAPRPALLRCATDDSQLFRFNRTDSGAYTIEVKSGAGCMEAVYRPHWSGPRFMLKVTANSSLGAPAASVARTCVGLGQAASCGAAYQKLCGANCSDKGLTCPHV